MTITLSLDRVGGTAADVSVHQLDASTFEHIDTVSEANGAIMASYTIPSGDDVYPTMVTVRFQKNPREGLAAIKRVTWTIATWARSADSVTGETVVKPVVGGMFLQIPPMAVEDDDLSQFMANIFGLTYGSLTSKVRDTAYLGKLRFGLPELYT